MAEKVIIGTVEKPIYKGEVAAPGHDCVIRNMAVNPDQGVLPAGLIVAFDSNGKIVPYDPAGTAPLNQPVGVLAVDVDTSRAEVAPVIVHGTVWLNKLSVKGNSPSSTDIDLLEEIYIWPVGI